MISVQMILSQILCQDSSRILRLRIYFQREGPKSTLFCFTSAHVFAYSTGAAFCSVVLMELSQLTLGYEKISLSTGYIQNHVSFKPPVRQLNLALKYLIHLHHAETNCLQYSGYIFYNWLLNWLYLTIGYCLKSSWQFL